MAILTYKFRLKDGNTAKKLKSMAGAVNFVWNFSNDIMRMNWKKSRKYTNEKDLLSVITATPSNDAVSPMLKNIVISPI